MTDHERLCDMDDEEYSAEMDRRIRAEYPRQVDEARTFMNKILYRSHKRKWLVFNGKTRDLYCELGELMTTLHYLSSLMDCRDQGDPVTEWFLDSAVRSCLGLGFAVIQGGKTE